MSATAEPLGVQVGRAIVIATIQSQAINDALRLLERGRTGEAQLVLNEAKARCADVMARAEAEVERLIGRFPRVVPPAAPVSQRDEE